jgi:hypothetical protein
VIKMRLGPFKTYVFSTIANFADMISSFTAFMHGYVELNGFMAYVHNSYLACLLSVVVFQLLISVVYYVSRFYGRLSIINAVFGIAKIVVSIHNTLLIV